MKRRSNSLQGENPRHEGRKANIGLARSLLRELQPDQSDLAMANYNTPAKSIYAPVRQNHFQSAAVIILDGAMSGGAFVFHRTSNLLP